jgi:hypothetical protein
MSAVNQNDLTTPEGMGREIVRLETICRRLAAALQTIEDRSGASGKSRHDRLIWTIAHNALHPDETDEKKS